jgi:hypothetical protein
LFKQEVKNHSEGGPRRKDRSFNEILCVVLRGRVVVRIIQNSKENGINASGKTNLERRRLSHLAALHSGYVNPPSSQYEDANILTAICRVAEPIALTSIFPYSWVMVREFHIGSPNDASFYAGILVAAFSLAEALTGMFWGGLSDRIGRKPVLLSGCAGTMLSLLIVGFASNYWVALFGRIVGGVLNGNIGFIQTMVGELVKRPDMNVRIPVCW